MLTINGKKVEFKSGQTVLEVAQAANIYIPTLCTHSQLSPFGACRMCIVKIEGIRGYTPACSTPAKNNMVIVTEDADIYELRRNIFELILCEHPNACIVCTQKDLCEKYHFCPTKAGRVTGCMLCSKKENCEICEVANYLNVKELSLPFNYKGLPLNRTDLFFERDYNLCILCGRCVRVCSDIRGLGVIAFTQRGHKTIIGTAFDQPLLEANCKFCGACIDVCPTGALTPRGTKWLSKPDKEIDTVCALCSVGCKLMLQARWGRVMGVSVSKNSVAHNRDQLCVRGRFCIPPLVNSTDRLRYPLIRRDGKLVPTNWDAVTTYIADKLKQYSSAEIGFLASPFLTNESAYLLQKFARAVIGTNNVDIMSSNVDTILTDTLVTSFGLDMAAGTSSLEHLENSNWIIIMGADIILTHPVITVSCNHAKSKGGKLILLTSDPTEKPSAFPRNVRNALHSVVASEYTRIRRRRFRSIIDQKPSALEKMLDIQIKAEPESYPALLACIIKLLVERGYFNTAFVSANCSGLDDLKNSIQHLDLNKITKHAGVSREEIELITTILKLPSKGTIIIGDNIPQSNIKEIITYLFNILLLTGNPDGLIVLRAGGNAQGVCDMGAVPEFLPMYQKISDERSRTKFERAWNVTMPINKGMSCAEMLSAASAGKLKALYLTEGINSISAIKQFDNVEFLVVQDTYPSDIFDKAHVVLPAAAFTESDGTITSLERRVQKLNKVTSAPGMAEPDWKIITDIAKKMVPQGFEYTNAEQILEEIASQIPNMKEQVIWQLAFTNKKFNLNPISNVETISKEPIILMNDATENAEHFPSNVRNAKHSVVVNEYTRNLRSKLRSMPSVEHHLRYRAANISDKVEDYKTFLNWYMGGGK